MKEGRGPYVRPLTGGVRGVENVVEHVYGCVGFDRDARTHAAFVDIFDQGFGRDGGGGGAVFGFGGGGVGGEGFVVEAVEVGAGGGEGGDPAVGLLER